RHRRCWRHRDSRGQGPRDRPTDRRRGAPLRRPGRRGRGYRGPRMIPTTLTDLAGYCDGTVHGDGDTVVTAPADADSRSVAPGGLFVAVVGERLDGHDFTGAAFEAGAAAVLCSRPVQEPCIVVPDPITALGRIARRVVDRLHGLRIVAV